MHQIIGGLLGIWLGVLGFLSANYISEFIGGTLIKVILVIVFNVITVVFLSWFFSKVGN